MGLQDGVNYIFNNPVSSSVSSGVSWATKKTISAVSSVLPSQTSPAPVITTIINEKVPLYKLAQECGPFVRVAGLMGASAIALGAYGSHKLPKEKDAELQKIYEIGNKYHFLNSLALLACPLCKYPKVSGSFMIVGIFLFSGACYYHAFTGKNKFGKLAPVGGTCLILGWMAMVA